MKTSGVKAVVTGASGAIGREIVNSLARAGFVCLCQYHKDSATAQEVLGQIHSFSPDSIAVGADLAEPDGIGLFCERVREFGRPDVLVNSAAVFGGGSVGEVSMEKARAVFDLNVLSPLMLCRCFAEMHAGKSAAPAGPRAKIINIADIGGIRPWAGYSVYCASKAALISLTKSLAKELAPDITVNAVAPGIVTWPDGFDEEQKQRQLRRIPAGRSATPAEVAGAVMFIINNDYITGHVINIDGGRCI